MAIFDFLFGSRNPPPVETTNISTTEIPKYIAEPTADIIGEAMDVAREGYTPYAGPRLAGFTQDEQDAFTAARNMQGIAGLQQDQAFTAATASGAPALTSVPSYMTDYQKQVADIAAGKLRDQSAIEQQKIAAQAAGAGGLDSSRFAILEAERQKNLQTGLGDLYPNAQAVAAWGGEDDETPVYGTVKIAIKAASGSNLTTQTKNDLVTQLKKYNVASVTPVIVDPETTDIILTTTAKFDEKATTKNADTIRSNIINTLTNYNSTTLQKFDSVFRHSKVVKQIDDTDSSILSNITTIKVRKSFTPTLSSSTRYDVYFRNGIFNPHSGHKASAGGVISSSGFKIDGDTTNVFYLDDDGEGNIRRYYFVGTVRTYANNTQGTVNYSTGQITINSLNVSSIENIRAAASSVIEITVEPASNDIVPVRDQILSIDTANSSITVEADTFVGGSASAGVGYTTTSSY